MPNFQYVLFLKYAVWKKKKSQNKFGVKSQKSQTSNHKISTSGTIHFSNVAQCWPIQWGEDPVSGWSVFPQGRKHWHKSPCPPARLSNLPASEVALMSINITKMSPNWRKFCLPAQDQEERK